MILNLPFPPSVNNLFLNARGTPGKPRVISARYREWRKRATAAMWGQKIEFFSGPVAITITLEEGRCDLDNLAKAILDHLVHHQIIPDDSGKYVRALSLRWGDVQGARVEIGPEIPAEAPSAPPATRIHGAPAVPDPGK